MATFRKHILLTALTLVIGLLCNSCNELDEIDMAQGTLRLSISQVTVKTETRATPSELGKPLASQFKLKLQRKGTSLVPYDGKFMETLQVKIGTYQVTATCGENVIIGRNAPYYVGTAEDVVVDKNATTPVNIPCRIANALVSVKFGKDAEERKRFDRHYEDFGVLVKIGDYSVEIPADDSFTSVYFRAGSSPKLYFYGLLKNDNNRLITFELFNDGKPLPALNEADHAIVTLNLPDPESATIVNIGKIAIEDANMDETIPLSWLPVPSATATHQYDENGYLVGTNVTLSNSYPGMQWKTVIKNTNGEEVRNIEGLGELTTKYENSDEWPYLPQGNYTAHYYFILDDGIKKVSSRDFTVGQPEIKVGVDGYSSYDKYLEGDIDAANKCDGKTIYEPTVRLFVSEKLLNDSKYNYSFGYEFEGTYASVAKGRNTYINAAIGGLKPRNLSYEIVCTATFDNVEAEGSKRIRITGIPFKFEPPTTTTWATVGDVSDESGYAQLGNMAWNSDQTMTYSDVYVPAGTAVVLDYRFDTIAGMSLENSTTLSSQNVTWVTSNAKGALISSTTVSNEAKKAIQDNTQVISSVICKNSNGAAACCTKLYRIGMTYGNVTK